MIGLSQVNILLDDVAQVNFGNNSLQAYASELDKNSEKRQSLCVSLGENKKLTGKDVIETPGNISVSWAPPLDALKMLKDSEVIEGMLPEIRLQNQRSNLVCRFWEMGKCQLGDLCTFKHSHD